MPTMEDLTMRILDSEELLVEIRKPDGSLVSPDEDVDCLYQSPRPSPNSMTVAQWKEKFSAQFPELHVTVNVDLNEPAHDGMTLGEVRAAYLFKIQNL